MILIFSITNDRTGLRVIKWLSKWGVDFVNVTALQRLKLVKINLSKNEIILSNGERQFNLADLTAVWFRKTKFYATYDKLKSQADDYGLSSSLNALFKDEHQIITEYINNKFKELRCLGNPNTLGLNKIQTLELAQNLGLHIPETLVSSNKVDVLEFQNRHKEIITKPIFEISRIYNEEFSITSPTKIITEQKIKELPDNFPLSLFQECINHLYELRCFYLNGEFYCNAIFFDRVDKIHVDRREFQQDHNHRRVPYELNKNLKEKLIKLMKSLELNTGSIDLLKRKTGEYCFLEINPVGQFGMTSFIGNYNVEKKIAAYLCQRA